MTRNSKSDEQNKQTPPRKRSLKRALLLTAISTIIVLLLLFYFFRPDLTTSSDQEVTPSSITQEEIHKPEVDTKNLDRLPGRWNRIDGGYTLEIISASKEGVLVAGYFNPNPINIGRAEWAMDKGDLFVMVELQDANYPGSTYGLQYDVDQDKLVGKYFQAVDESTFDVEFIRE